MPTLNFNNIAILDTHTLEHFRVQHPKLDLINILQLWMKRFNEKQGDAILIRDSAKEEENFHTALSFCISLKPTGIPIICNHRSQTLLPGTQGVHYKRGSKRTISLKEGIAGISAHSKEGCYQAEKKGFDYVFISPVFPTHSHPGEAALGLEKLSRICTSTQIPVYGLGGINNQNRESCFVAGVKGTASISMFMPDTHYIDEFPTLGL